MYDAEEGARRICRMPGDRPVSADNIVARIPIVNEYGVSGVGVIHPLHREDIRVNATAILSFNQAALAARARAS